MTAALRLDATGHAGVFADLRCTEFSRLDEQGLVYLDYTGAAIPAESQLRAHNTMLRRSLLGNPHSEHEPSRASTALIENARDRVLRFLGADPCEYCVVFTANTSAAIKLVAESFPFRRGSRLALSADNHNSVNGIREYARRRGATVVTLPLASDLRLADAIGRLRTRVLGGPSLFAFPAQSNFSGVRHPLTLVSDAQQLGYRVLLDAAAFVPTSPLQLGQVRPDFVALSFYKMFGFPTGLGALVARRDALAQLKRPWFAGGTVDWASVQHRVHQLRASVAAFEDGTPNYYGLAAVDAGFDLLDRVDMHALSARVVELMLLARAELTGATHANGQPAFRVYGPENGRDQGGTVALNLLDDSGRVLPYERVEHAARDARLAVRGGCFCNPGASETAFGFQPDATKRCLRLTSQDAFTPRRFGECLGADVAIGAIRISVGLATTERDVVSGARALAQIARGDAGDPARP